MQSNMKNTIIWIDGAIGVGKSHIAAKLAEHLTNKNVEYVDSDLCWRIFLREHFQYHFKGIYGLELYNNKDFLDKFRKGLEEKINNLSKIPIVSMSLVSKLCKRELLDYFEKKKVTMFHIILEATEETIIFRIENDPMRNENMKNQ